MFHRSVFVRRCFVIGLALLTTVFVVRVADAATFSITIKNTTTYQWGAGIISFSPLLPLGLTPTSGNAYDVYGFTTSDCNVFANDDADATDLVPRIGLTIGSTAFIVPTLAAGATTTVVINASPGQKMSYIADVYGSGTEAADDIIMMHAVGDPTNLSVPLFDSAGYPLATIAFELSGYDTNSTSSTNGNGPSCSPDCPTPKTGCYVAPGNGTTGETLTAQPTQPNLALTWTYPAGSSYSTDGLALGDLNTSTAGNELVVVLEAGQYSGVFNTLGKGRAQVLTRAGTAQTSFDASANGRDLMGVPLIEGLKTTTAPFQFLASEFVAATPLPGGSVYARNGDSTVDWTSTGYGYPGFWNMGPSSGIVRTDVSATVPEVIVADWGGDIAVLDPVSPSITYDTYSTYASNAQQQIYGHVGVGPVTTSANQIVAFTAGTATSGTGMLLALNVPGTGKAANQKMTTSAAITLPSGVYAFGSGPAIGDIDGDGNPEIVIASAGTGKVYAYDLRWSKTTCKYQWTSPGGFDYSWTSPVIGKVDTGTFKDVVVFSSDSKLSVLSVSAKNTGSSCVNGIVKYGPYTVGNGGTAWFTPALANLSGANTATDPLEIVVANYTTFEVVSTVSGALAPVYRYVDSTAQFYPSAVIEAGTGSAGQLYVSGWSNHNVYRLDLPSGAPTPAAWTTFMGSNQRTGAR